MAKIMHKRMFAMLLAGSMLILELNFLQPGALRASATQSRTKNYSKNYTLTGNGSTDMVNVGMAQKGKTQSELGYTEAWCADFISDLAVLAGQTAAIPFNATAAGIHNDVQTAGGNTVSSPQAGDIVCYYCSSCGRYVHVGLMVDGTNSIQGNYNSKVTYVSNPGTYTDAAGHKCATGTVTYEFVRPNYTGTPAPDPVIRGHVMSEAEGAGRTIPDGYYWIGSAMDSHYFLDIVGVGAAASCTNCTFQTCDDNMPTEYDVWKVTYLNNGFYEIKQRAGDVCLEVGEASLDNDANVRVYTTNKSIAQQWSIEETDTGYVIKARCSSFNLDACGAVVEDGANAMQHVPHGDPNQRFTFIPADSDDRPIADGVYGIYASGNSAFFVDGAGKNYKSGANVVINSGTSAMFRFRYTGKGWYEITEFTSGLALDVDNTGYHNFADRCRNIMLFTPNGGNNQRWRIMKNSDDTYTFISKISGYSLDLYMNALSNGSTIVQHPYNGSAAQKFKVTQKTYTLTVDPNGGTYCGSTSAAVKNPKLIYGSGNWWHIGEQGNAARKGYTLTGYYDAKTGGTKVYGADGVSAETKYFKSKTYVNMGNLTVYARWQANDYTVSFDSCGGAAASSKKVQMDAQYGTLPGTSRSGYTFDGWFTAKTGGTQVKADTKFTSAANQTLYAHWTLIPVETTTTTTETTTTTTETATTTETTAALALRQDALTVENGAQFTVEANQENLVYKSNDPDVAVISKTGKLTAVGEGSAIITVINSEGDAVQMVLWVIPVGTLGDANRDGRINAIDLTLAKRILLGDAAMNAGADVNRDGAVTIADVIWYEKFIMGDTAALP